MNGLQSLSGAGNDIRLVSGLRISDSIEGKKQVLRILTDGVGNYFRNNSPQHSGSDDDSGIQAFTDAEGLVLLHGSLSRLEANTGIDEQAQSYRLAVEFFKEKERQFRAPYEDIAILRELIEAQERGESQKQRDEIHNQLTDIV